MIRQIITFSIFIVFISSLSLQAQSYIEDDDGTSRGASGDTASIKGLLVKQPKYNSNGTVIPGKFEYFIEANDESMLLKLDKSTVTASSLDPYVGKKARIFGVIWDGPFDSDDPSAITRVGIYMNVIRIEK